MRISGTEPSAEALSHSKWFQVESEDPKIPKRS